MITRDYLLGNGFERYKGAPSSVEEFVLQTKPQGGSIFVRFNHGGTEPCGLYAYSENYDHSNVRKVVINDSIVKEEDLEMAKTICRL